MLHARGIVNVGHMLRSPSLLESFLVGSLLHHSTVQRFVLLTGCTADMVRWTRLGDGSSPQTTIRLQPPYYTILYGRLIVNDGSINGQV